MDAQANVHSTEALEALRAALVIYQSKAKRSVDTALEEARAAQRWVQEEQRLYWEQEIRKRDRLLERARAELMTVRMSALADHTVMQREAVQRAERALTQAREKLSLVKRWSREMDTVMGPHLRRLESVREHFQHQLPKATAFLHQAQMTLADYSGRAPTPGPPGAPAAVDEPGPQGVDG
jgi:multidrug resistance efflux pump